MPPPPYVLTAHASDEFDAILYELAETSGWDRSMDLEERLYEAFLSLAANPGIGHLRQDLLPHEIYFHYVRPYMVVYRRNTSPLLIIAVIHGARDIPALVEGRL